MDNQDLKTDLILSDSEEMTTISGEVLYQQDRAQIDTQIATAKAYPRNVSRAISNVKAMVVAMPDVAKTCVYALPRGGKTIQGPSVHLARMLAQTWGNLRVEARLVGVDETHVTSEAVAFDLENNLAIKVQVKRSIMDKNGQRFGNDMITVTGNAANAIALRNAVLGVIPKAVSEVAYKTACTVINGDVSDVNKLEARRKQVIDGFKDSFGVNEGQIMAILGRASINHINAEDLIVLVGLANAIKDGDTTVAESFGRLQEISTPEMKLADRLKILIKDAKTVELAESYRAKAKELGIEKLVDDKIKTLKGK